MANLNVNIAKKLISYVRHGVDINDGIKDIYNNSLIFIGDESQIYVPAMNTYVGIGNTAYNNTISRIDAIEDDISTLKDTLATDLVTKIYANYSFDEMTNSNNPNRIKDDTSEAGDLALTLKSNGKDLWALSNEITLKGIGDYDTSTGFAKNGGTGHQYVLDLPAEAGGGITYVTNSTLYRRDNGKAQATSGITITPHWGEMEDSVNEVTGQVIRKRVGNYIEIDDKLTWSYMTSAYSYALNFSKRYTANEIDRLYHNLLGDYRAAYLPSNFEEIAIDESAFINELSAAEYRDYIDAHVVADYEDENTGKHTYYVIDSSRFHDVDNVPYSGVFIGTYASTSYYETDENPVEKVRTDNIIYHELKVSELTSLLEDPTTVSSLYDYQTDTLINYTSQEGVFATFPQLYVLDTQYDSTYNMNIADGINTLKEVAYLLDKLSDGSLGSTTYLTYNDLVDTATVGNPVRSNVFVWDNESSCYTYYANETYYPIVWNSKQVDINNLNEIDDWHSPKPNDIVGWYVITGDQDNLGIQIAYSIAGNKTQIDDLHTHTDLLEKGETTLRSIQSTSSNFVTIDLVGGQRDANGNPLWADTDSKQGSGSFNQNHPNWNIDNSEGSPREATTSYLVGDVNIKVKLNTATVYSTTYTVDVTSSTGTPINKEFTDEFGVTWYGSYTAADMNALISVPSGISLSSDTTYYVKVDNIDPSVPPTFILVHSDEQDATADMYGRLSETDVDNRYRLEGTQYYWKPGGTSSINDNTQNLKYTKITRSELNALGVNDALASDKYNLTKSTTYYFISTNSGYEPAGYWSDILSDTTHDAFYYISSYEDNMIHAVEGENKVATTEWVGAFVDTKVGVIEDALEDTLEKAKKYTDDEIGKLDNNYKYSDFATYWLNYTENLANGLTVTIDIDGTDVEYVSDDIKTTGTTANINTYNKFYQDYCESNNLTIFGGVQDPITNPYRLSYISNSQYAYNIIETDGIVTAEARELPTDKLNANVQIWGDESNLTNKYVYSEITLDHPRNSSLLQSLYNWAAENDDNQLFISIYDESTGTYTYMPLDPTDVNVGDIDLRNPITNQFGGDDDTFYELYNGSYVEIEITDITARFGTAFDASVWKYTNTSDKFWFRVYQKGPVYYELNLQDAKAVDSNNVLVTEPNAGTADKNKVKIGDYLLVRSNNTVSVSGPGITNTTPLLYISSKPESSTKYFTVENKHFSYVNNGSGENEFNVTAHITKIEDATSTNTGFADAFDVQSYIENYFKWIDVSASISEERVEHSDDYYTMITLEEYRRILAAVDAEQNLTTAQRKALPKYVQFDQNDNVIRPVLYKRTDHSNEGNLVSGAYLIDYDAVVDPTISLFWKDNNDFYSNMSVGDTFEQHEQTAENQPGDHIRVPSGGDYLYEQFNSNNVGSGDKFTKYSNYYVRLEEPKVNPLNFEETKFGNVPQAPTS